MLLQNPHQIQVTSNLPKTSTGHILVEAVHGLMKMRSILRRKGLPQQHRGFDKTYEQQALHATASSANSSYRVAMGLFIKP